MTVCFTIHYIQLPHFTLSLWCWTSQRIFFFNFPTLFLWFPRWPNCQNLLQRQIKATSTCKRQPVTRLCVGSALPHRTSCRAAELPHHCSPSQHLDARRDDKGIHEGSGGDLWLGCSNALVSALKFCFTGSNPTGSPASPTSNWTQWTDECWLESQLATFGLRTLRQISCRRANELTRSGLLKTLQARLLREAKKATGGRSLIPKS